MMEEGQTKSSSSPSSWMEEGMREILSLRAEKGSLRVYKEEKDDDEHISTDDQSSEVVALDFSSNDYLGLARSVSQQQLVEERYQKLTLHLQGNNKKAQVDQEQQQKIPVLGSTGSRLLSGDSDYARQVEIRLARWHNRPAALLFNSGYDANLSVLSCLPCDYFVFDEYSHNSLRMGMRLSSRRRKQQRRTNSPSTTNREEEEEENYDDGGADDNDRNGSAPADINKRQEQKTHVSFAHNNVEDLRAKLFAIRAHHGGGNVSSSSTGEVELERMNTTSATTTGPRSLIVVESVYSMDGDVAPLQSILDLAKEFGALVLVDEAHGLGVFGCDDDGDGTTRSFASACRGGGSGSSRGVGVLAQLHLEDHPALACSIHTFGKAAGCHGAVVCGSRTLRQYLWNYGWPLVYSTSLPLHSLVAIECSYETMTSSRGKYLRQHNQRLVSLFRRLVQERILNNQQQQYHHEKLYLLPSLSPIQALVLPQNGNQACTEFCDRVWSHSNRTIRLYPIKSPTVPIGMERIRIILHGHNKPNEVYALVECMFRSLVDMHLVNNRIDEGGAERFRDDNSNFRKGQQLLSRL